MLLSTRARSITPQVVAIIPSVIPSTTINVVKPLTHLQFARLISARIYLEDSLVPLDDLAKADLVVFCRNVQPIYAQWLEFVLKNKIPYAYDLDDNFFDIPSRNPVAKYYRPKQLAMLKRYLTNANLVRVYSNELLAKIHDLNSKVVRVQGPMDIRLIPEKRSTRRTRRIKLAYETSLVLGHEYEDIYIGPLMRVLEEYRGKIELHFWGHLPRRLRGSKDVYFHPFMTNYDRFIKSFASSNYDIGLAPLNDDSFTRSKSDNKFRDYGACGIAGIYSKVRAYTESVVDHETGLIVENNPEAWHNAIVNLIEDKQLREKIQRQAREYVQIHYSQRMFEEVWYRHIRYVLGQRGLIDHLLMLVLSVRTHTTQGAFARLISYIGFRITMRHGLPD